MTDVKRAPVQGDGMYHLSPDDPRFIYSESHRPGTISWDEHEQAWQSYHRRFGNDQSAERLAERGGFSYRELQMFLGHDPETYEAKP